MTDSLTDRLKNEYSTKYSLVLKEKNYYPQSSDATVAVLEEKINNSAAPGTDTEVAVRTSVDPFRQAIGRMWSFRDKNIGFYAPSTDGTLPITNVQYSTKGSLIPTKTKYEDVTQFWSQTFDKGSSGNLNLDRKATRIKLFFDSSDLLVNRLTMLSMLTDINAKNKQAAYTFVDNNVNSATVELKFPSLSQTTSYNYNSMFGTQNIQTPVGKNLKQLRQLVNAGEGTDQGWPVVVEEVENNWSEYALEALNQASKNGALDSFYDASANTYSYAFNFGMYYDHAFQMDLPMSVRATSLTNDMNKSSLVSDIKSRYNYYSKFYEAGTSQKEVKLYDSGNQKLPFNETSMPLIYEVPIDNDGTPGFPTEEGESKFKFESFGHKLLNCGYVPDDSEDKKNFNIVLYQDSQSYLNKYNNIKYQFPFYVNFDFSSDSRRAFTQVFNESGIGTNLIETLISNVFNKKVSEDGSNTAPNKNSHLFDGETIYYNALDSDPTYSDSSIKDQSPPICQRGIYLIDEYRDFFQVTPPTTSEDKDALGTDLIKQGYKSQLREMNLNKWIESYINYMTSVSSAGDNTNSESDPLFMTEVVKRSYAFINSNRFGENVHGSSGTCPDQDNAGLGQLLKLIRFMGKFRGLVKSTLRSYEDILNKKPAYNEALFYRIQKVAVDSNGSPINNGVVQNIWLPKPSNIEDNQEMMRYIDTQVKYGQSYEYTIYSYNIVIGSKYGFQLENRFTGNDNSQNIIDYAVGITDSAAKEGYIDTALEFLYQNPSPANNNYNRLFKNDADGSRMAMFDVLCEADIKLVEVPFYKKTTLVNDAPSTAPEIDILPLNGKNNELKFSFYPSTVDRELQPIAVELKDYVKFNKIRKAQDRDLLKMSTSTGGILGMLPKSIMPPNNFVEPRLQFRSDDYPVEYQIYRLSNPPISYSSFANNKKTTINATSNQSTMEKLQQNKKYYYMFRSVDVHGNPSNPSPVYQVELVENSGVVYPIISIYEFQSPKKGEKSKSFRKYLKIDAESLQGMLNLKESGLEESETALGTKKPVLGIKKSPIFNFKKFKFRIKSKHTGKIVELNVEFKTRHKEPPGQVLTCGDAGQPAPIQPEVFEASESSNGPDSTNSAGSSVISDGFDGM